MFQINIAPANHIAPLIYTPSWGEPSTSWHEINSWIPANESDQPASVSVTVPTTPGVYHVLFAYFWEIGAEHVASGTNWQVGTNNWNDGDEVARYSATQIAQGQANGMTVAPQ